MTSYQESEGIDRPPGPGMERYTSCLIPVIASILLLAGLIALVNFLFVGGSNTTTETIVTSESDASDAAAKPGKPLAETLPDRYDNQTIFGVFRALGWSAYGVPDVVELGSRQHITRKFRKNEAHVEIDLQIFESRSAASQKIEDMDEADNAVRLDHKLVIVRGLDKAGSKRVSSLVERLIRFRQLVEESEDE